MCVVGSRSSMATLSTRLSNTAVPTLQPQAGRAPSTTVARVGARSAGVFCGSARLAAAPVEAAALAARRTGRTAARGTSVKVMSALADRPTATAIEQLKFLQPGMAEKIRTEVPWPIPHPPGLHGISNAARTIHTLSGAGRAWPEPADGSCINVTCRAGVGRGVQVGTPAYVYDLATLRAQGEKALAFPNSFGLTVRYAMKSSPNAAILQVFNAQGIHIDASSGYMPVPPSVKPHKHSNTARGCMHAVELALNRLRGSVSCPLLMNEPLEHAHPLTPQRARERVSAVVTRVVAGFRAPGWRVD